MNAREIAQKYVKSAAVGRNAAIGAGLGALLGGVHRYLRPPKDEEERGVSSWLRDIGAGAGIGALGGAGGTLAYDSLTSALSQATDPETSVRGELKENQEKGLGEITADLVSSGLRGAVALPADVASGVSGFLRDHPGVAAVSGGSALGGSALSWSIIDKLRRNKAMSEIRNLTDAELGDYYAPIRKALTGKDVLDPYAQGLRHWSTSGSKLYPEEFAQLRKSEAVGDLRKTLGQKVGREAQRRLGSIAGNIRAAKNTGDIAASSRLIRKLGPWAIPAALLGLPAYGKWGD